ncbi:unnamed protein product, partial [Prorocentrum cordatum]
CHAQGGRRADDGHRTRPWHPVQPAGPGLRAGAPRGAGRWPPAHRHAPGGACSASSLPDPSC